MTRFGTAVLAAIACCALEPRVLGPTVAAQQPSLLYVCIQDEAKVAVVDMTARSVLRTIDFQKLGFPATAKPHYVVVENDKPFKFANLAPGKYKVRAWSEQSAAPTESEIEIKAGETSTW